MSADFFQEIRDAVALLKSNGLESWANRFEEMLAGSTGGEILMGIRFQAQQFLADPPTKDSVMIVRIEGLERQAAAALS